MKDMHIVNTYSHIDICIWLPTPVFLPGKSHGERSLVGYRPWAHKELDTTEQLSTASGFSSSEDCGRIIALESEDLGLGTSLVV